MKISNEKAEKLYGAIIDPIIELRIEIQHRIRCSNPIEPNALDHKLWRLQSDIWRKVRKALNLEYEL